MERRRPVWVGSTAHSWSFASMLLVLSVLAGAYVQLVAGQCMVPSTGETGYDTMRHLAGHRWPPLSPSYHINIAGVIKYTNRQHDVTDSGDGYLATFSSTLRIYNVYHHQEAEVVCLDPIAGTICAGTPIIAHSAIPGFSAIYSTLQTPPGFDGQIMLNEQYLFFTATAYDNTNAYPHWGIACFDTLAGGPGAYCSTGGFLALGTSPVNPSTSTSYGGGLVAFPGGVPNQFLTFGGDLSLYCVVLSGTTGAMSPCPAPHNSPLTPTLGGTTASAPLLLTLGTKVYATYEDGTNAYVVCYDFSQLSPYPCNNPSPGITTRVMMFSGSPELYNTWFAYDATMTPTHICTSFFRQMQLSCVQLSDGAMITTLPSYVSNSNWFVGNLGSHATIGTKSFFSLHSDVMADTIRCWDWASNAQCGQLVAPAGGSFYYAITVDPDGCMWALSDSHVSVNFDVNFNTPCATAPHGIANTDFLLLNTPIPCMSSVAYDVLANDVFIFPSSLTATSSSPVTSSAVTIGPPYELQWTPPSSCSGAGWTGIATVSYRVCSNAWATSSATANWYIVSNPGPIVLPSISYTVVDFQSTTVPLSDWIMQGVFPIDYNSFQILTNVSPQIGWVTYNPSPIPSLTFLPNRNLAAPLVIRTQICDNPGTIGSPPITIPRVCKQTVVTFVPYYVHWAAPNLDPYTFWYMYWPGYIEWNSNLPDDFQLQLALVKLPSMTNVANFVLPLQDINGNATWTPHNMMPGKYQLYIKSYGNSIPAFNHGYQWPSSGVIELRIKPPKG